MDTPRRKRKNEETKRRVNSGRFSLQNWTSKRPVDQAGWIQNSLPVERHRIPSKDERIQGGTFRFACRKLIRKLQGSRMTPRRKKEPGKFQKNFRKGMKGRWRWIYSISYLRVQFLPPIYRIYGSRLGREIAFGVIFRRRKVFKRGGNTIASWLETKRMVRSEPVLISCGW